MPGVFGTNIAPIRAPSPSADLAAVYPNLSATNTALSGDILSQLKGELSPDTIQNIINSSAIYGVSSGMPRSGLARNLIPRSIGLATQDLQNRGIANYEGAIPTISSTQTLNPSIQAEVSATNAYNAAAPDPGEAARYALGLYDQYLNPPGSTGWILKNNPSYARAIKEGGGSAYGSGTQWYPGSALGAPTARRAVGTV